VIGGAILGLSNSSLNPSHFNGEWFRGSLRYRNHPVSEGVPMHFPLFCRRVRCWLERLSGEAVDTALTLLEDARTMSEVVEVCELSGVGNIPETIISGTDSRATCEQACQAVLMPYIQQGLQHLLRVQTIVSGMTFHQQNLFLHTYLTVYGMEKTNEVLCFILARRVKNAKPELTWKCARDIARSMIENRQMRTA